MKQLWTENGLPVIAPQHRSFIRTSWVDEELVKRGYWLPIRGLGTPKKLAPRVRRPEGLTRSALTDRKHMEVFGRALGLHPAQIWPEYYDWQGVERARPLARHLRMFARGRKDHFASQLALRYPIDSHSAAPPKLPHPPLLHIVAPQSSYNARWRWLAERLAELRVWTVQNPNSWELMSFPDGLLARCDSRTWTDEFRHQVADVLELHPSQIWPEYYVAAAPPAQPAPLQRALTLPARSTARQAAPILTAAEAPGYDTLPETISYAFGGAS